MRYTPYHEPTTNDSGFVGGTHQHCGSKIEFVEELCYENVYFKNVRHVLTLDITQDIDEPLEVLVRWTNPEEIHL